MHEPHLDPGADWNPRVKAFIREQANSGGARPFFLYVPLSAPHTPWMPTPEFIGRSEAGYYGDFVAQVDDTVGRIMQVLEETGYARRENQVYLQCFDDKALRYLRHTLKTKLPLIQLIADNHWGEDSGVDYEYIQSSQGLK